MKIYLGTDHRGFQMKEWLKKHLIERKYEVEDMGAYVFDADDDYPVYARKVAEAVAEDPENRRGIVLCGSGVGVDIVANKIRGIRAAHVFTSDIAMRVRADDDTNVLALAADALSDTEAHHIVKMWLETPFSGLERHVRRLKEIEQLEKEVYRD